MTQRLGYALLAALIGFAPAAVLLAALGAPDWAALLGAPVAPFLAALAAYDHGTSRNTSQPDK